MEKRSLTDTAAFASARVFFQTTSEKKYLRRWAMRISYSAAFRKVHAR